MSMKRKGRSRERSRKRRDRREKEKKKSEHVGRNTKKRRSASHQLRANGSGRVITLLLFTKKK